jgi:hypothetical protein
MVSYRRSSVILPDYQWKDRELERLHMHVDYLRASIGQILLMINNITARLYPLEPCTHLRIHVLPHKRRSAVFF